MVNLLGRGGGASTCWTVVLGVTKVGAQTTGALTAGVGAVQGVVTPLATLGALAQVEVRLARLESVFCKVPAMMCAISNGAAHVLSRTVTDRPTRGGQGTSREGGGCTSREGVCVGGGGDLSLRSAFCMASSTTSSSSPISVTPFGALTTQRRGNEDCSCMPPPDAPPPGALVATSSASGPSPAEYAEWMSVK